MSVVDDERLTAAVLLIGHTGARDFEVGYLRDGVPTSEADWWAKAAWHGERITVEHLRGPVEATEALALRLLTSARCTWCDGLITTSPVAAEVWPGATMLDGSSLPTDPDELAALGQCLWRRVGRRWEPGCLHAASTGPKAPRDRAARRRLQRTYLASRPRGVS